MEAILLVGGQGTRLRPLTLTTPKPMLPLAGIPFITHQLLRARRAGLEHVVLATSYRAEMFSEHFGDGSGLGLRLSYAVEPGPLGTGGAVRNAAAYLRGSGPVVVLNGDVLAGLDLRGLLAHHRQADAEITIQLRSVPDPAGYGVVTTGPGGRVQSFQEKTDRPLGNQVNGGTYVFTRDALMSIPPGRVVSLERETFPAALRGSSLITGVPDDTYWLDIGTPAAYVRGNCDLVLGRAPSAAVRTEAADRLLLDGAQVADTASLSGGTVVGRGAVVGEGAALSRTVVFDDARIGAGAAVSDSVIGRGAQIGAGAVVEAAMIADRARVPAGARVAA
jgi:mannose-1-phosphate guanylyltransferase